MKHKFPPFFTAKKTLLSALVCLIGGIALSLYSVRASTNPAGTEVPPDPSFRQEDYEKLLALQFDCYENMSISQYQDRVWQQTDTTEYRRLMEQFSKSTSFYEMRDDNALASFFFYLLEPVTAEQWQTHSFSSSVQADLGESLGHGLMEYVYTLTIQDPDALTIRDYAKARAGISNDLQSLLLDQSPRQLQDENRMQETLRREAEALSQKWSSDSLRVTAECGYRTSFPGTANAPKERPASQTEPEARTSPNGTQEDYDSLLELKTPHYQELPLADFNDDLLEWANQDYQRMERIDKDLAREDFPPSLDEDGLPFVTVTVRFSGIENGAYVEHLHTGQPQKDPSYGVSLPEKTSVENGRSLQCSLYYEFSYHIADPSALTVGERDRCMEGMTGEIQQLWADIHFQELLDMNEEAFAERFRQIAASHSSSQLTITLKEDRLFFDKTEDLLAGTADPYRLLLSCRPQDPAHTTVAGYHASLTPDPDALSRLLDAYAQLDISPEDEAYEYLTVTLNSSLRELYGEIFDEIPFFRTTLSRQERPYPYTDADGETLYQFWLYADVILNYRLLSPETLTLAERDKTLLTFRREISAYVDSLSEEEITDSGFRKKLEEKGSALAAALSTDKMQLSCEIGQIDLFSEGGE